MNTFARAMNDIIKTENGALTYSTSLSANLDMFGLASAMRGSDDAVLKLFHEAYKEDKNLAIKNLFYLRDIRGGQGERQIFRSCSKWLAEKLILEEFQKFIQYIPVYGRWDDVINLINDINDAKKKVIFAFMQKQFKEDINNMKQAKFVSLLAKWYPLENNTNNPEAKKFAIYLRKQFFKNAAECRKTVVKLRKYLNVLEQKISANKWDSVNYASVPSCASLKYRKAFARHDSERYTQYIEDVVNGKAKINSSVLYPYEIIQKIIDSEHFDSSTPNELDALWNNLPDYTNGNSAICCVDVSGSMYDCNSIYSSVALGLYFAERNKGEFGGKFFTFESNPDIVKLKGNTLAEKVGNMLNAEWGGSTNISGLFDLYLHIAKNSKPEDCPKTLIIISDMEFDYCVHNEDKQTLFEIIRKRYEEAGIALPTLVFWNVNARHNNLPVRYDESGTVLVSGNSPTTFQYICEGGTPEEFMMRVLDSERYSHISL